MKLRVDATPPGARRALKGSHYIRRSNDGLIIQSWPRKRPTIKSGYQFYSLAEFAIAQRWAIDADPIARETARRMAKGTSYTWRDILMMAAYGRLFEITLEDGTTLLPDRDVTPNPQQVLDLVSDIPGAMLYRADIGWVVVLPGDDGDVLQIKGKVPFWNASTAGITADLLLGTHDPYLVNQRVIGDSNSIKRDISQANVALFKRAALTGDVTADFDSNVTHLSNGSATLATLANLAANARVIGSAASGSKAPIELSLSDILDFINSASRGDVLARGASAWLRVPAGTTSQFLRSGDSTHDTAFADLPAVTSTPGGTNAPFFSDTDVFLSNSMIGNALAIQNFGAVANTIYFLPLQIAYQRTFTKIAVVIGSGGAVAGSHARIGIYNVDTTNGHPTTNAFDSGDLDTSTTGLKTATLSLTLPAGPYFLALWCSAAIQPIGTAQTYTTTYMGMRMTATAVAPVSFLKRALTYSGGMPDETSQTETSIYGSSTVPIVGIR